MKRFLITTSGWLTGLLALQSGFLGCSPSPPPVPEPEPTAPTSDPKPGFHILAANLAGQLPPVDWLSHDVVLLQASEDFHSPHDQVARLRGTRKDLYAGSYATDLVLAEAHSNLTYQIQGQELRFDPGILEVDLTLPDGGTTRVIVAELKNRTYSPLSHSNLRKSEARKLASLIQKRKTEHPLLLVAVSLHVEPNLEPYDLVRDDSLVDLRPLGPAEAAWTFYDEESDSNYRRDYFFASTNLAGRIAESNLIASPGLTHRALRLRLKSSAGDGP